jgi:hypothetical protein
VPGHVHVDEVFVRVNGRFRPALQAVVSRAGYCLDISLECCRDTKAYERFFKRLKKRLGGLIRARFREERHKPVKRRRLVIDMLASRF